MLLYWEIVEKSKSPTDKSLKEEVFLACNSLRNDLIGHNEYVRGRTLRLVSRIMHKGVIEPLAGAITNNLSPLLGLRPQECSYLSLQHPYALRIRHHRVNRR
jgi:vesicle coat complex subunit